MRKIEFANNEYYHIYNRGAGKQEIFCNDKDFLRFIDEMKEFNNVKAAGGLRMKKSSSRGSASTVEAEPLIELLVEIICYCLNPNHYHFILRQLVENGISKFMHKVGTGYPSYFNIKYNSSGHLFQGPFQAKHIDTNGYLLWLSGYVNGNPEIHGIAQAEKWYWSSYRDYLGLRNGTICNKEIILSQLNSRGSASTVEAEPLQYKKYVDMVVEESSKRKEDMRGYTLE